MNTNSLICQFISNNPENWEELLSNSYKIKIKKDGDYAILNYIMFDCNFSDPIVQECRGIIVDYVKKEVVCWPFRKFGNYNEYYCDEIDWESARVLEKVDGSIIKLWFDSQKNDWQFSTNGTIRAENANVNEHVLELTFGEVILNADNYSDIPFDTLDKTNTYIFELVSPETKLVVSYPFTRLYHLGTRNNITGKEMELDIGIVKPKSYPITTLADCLRAAKALNADNESCVENEGFVVVDKNYHRVKIKTPDYLMVSKISQIKTLAKKDIVEMLLEGSNKIGMLCENNPHLAPYFKYYEFKLEELKYLSNKMAILARGLYKEFDKNRGAVAKIIASHRVAHIGFAALENEDSGVDILLSLPIERLIKLIPDYELEDLRNLLLKE